ncbi:hypothetical protein [Dyella psychrodurans]|nr:hypothetical protein [Dyella psychrodurans]
MKKGTKVALWSLAAIALALGSAAVGFYEGLGVGARTMGGIAETNAAHDALSEVRYSMVALGSSDLNLSQHQLAVHMRAALFQLGALSTSKTFIQCTDKDKRALTAAAAYVAMHPDPVLFKPDTFLTTGMTYCETDHVDARTTRVEFDLPSSLFGKFGRSEVTNVGLSLDKKLVALISIAAEKASKAI